MKAILPILALSSLLSACVDRAGVQALSAVDRQVSAAVADQVRRCYRSPRGPSVARRISTRLYVRYRPDGSLLDLPILVSQQGITPESRPYAGRMAEAAKIAVIRCAPVSVPAEAGKRRESAFLLTFSPQMVA